MPVPHIFSLFPKYLEMGMQDESILIFEPISHCYVKQKVAFTRFFFICGHERDYIQTKNFMRMFQFVFIVNNKLKYDMIAAVITKYIQGGIYEKTTFFGFWNYI